LMRKILADNGAKLERFLAKVEATIAQTGSDFATYSQRATDLVAALRQRLVAIGQAAKTNPELPYQLATEALRLVGHCALSWMWLRTANVAASQLQSDPDFYNAKLNTANY